MIETLPFQTRARTVDHLGREQIADCPTAISELWKNAYDAYAKKVELHLYKAEVPVAAVVDNGHGMDRDEFVDKWLVVGTESKATNNTTPIEDRNGLPERIRQGQKGIGRLSCANIAPLLLMVSKRRDRDFVASLLDWRLFENPYLILSDIRIPVVEFSQIGELLGLLPELFDRLLTNLWGEKPAQNEDGKAIAEKSAHKARVEAAWSAYDNFVAQERRDRNDIPHDERDAPLPSQSIASTLISTVFKEEHFKAWPVWKGESKAGTALLMAELDYDLLVQLADTEPDTAAKSAIAKFTETLSSFTDPFWQQSTQASLLKDNLIEYGVFKTVDGKMSQILGSSKNFTLSSIDYIEHVVDGRIDHDGKFSGRLKIFGRWHENIAVDPPRDLSLPTAANTKLGPIDVFVATAEMDPKNTTHSDEQHAQLTGLMELYSGLMVHRDGLRVLPFGRTDADFFDIEQRRSIHAGRQFWNYRRMFGRLGISKKFNPNLTDKAGREGILDNRAAKTFKSLIVHILTTLAKEYFGTDSKIRKHTLPPLQAAYKEKRAAKAQEKLNIKLRGEFRQKLKKIAPRMAQAFRSAEAEFSELNLTSKDSINYARTKIDNSRIILQELSLDLPPGSLNDENRKLYDEYFVAWSNLKSLLREMTEKLNIASEEVFKDSLLEQADKATQLNNMRLADSLTHYQNQIGKLQTAEFKRVSELINLRKDVFKQNVDPILTKLESGAINYATAIASIEDLREEIETENKELFEPYIRTLECLSESIDLEALATFGVDQVSQLSSEVDRLNSLAQLGIAIEILGHELQSYDDLIGAGLRELPKELTGTDAYLSIETGYYGLVDQLRFLSPLKLAGPKIQRWVSGAELYEYVHRFFRSSLEKNKIELRASDEFLKFKVYDQPARLYPVFINLVNNSRYWLSHSAEENRQISFLVEEGKVLISDNGPGVSFSDIDNLFTLFFTRKQAGGRGVGLYLCRANLAAGGHKITYESHRGSKLRAGANFAISFQGAEYA